MLSNVDVDGIPDMGRVWSMDLVELSMEPKPFARGAFGHVYKGEYFGTPVCVKILKNEDPNEREHSFKLIQREVTSLKFGHPNLVQFMGAAEKGDEIYIITEYIHGGNLRQYIKDERVHIPWALRAQIAKDIACGMAYLHSKGIIHRDLKSKNLLVGDNWRIKICDFGFARSVSRRQLMTVCGTGDWMAPEVLQGLDYDEKADVYSFGIVICELITRRKASDDLPRSPLDFSLDTTKIMPLIPEDCPAPLLNLAIACVAWDPHMRPAFKEITRTLKGMVTSLTPSPTSYPRPSSFSLLSTTTTSPPVYFEASPPTSPGHPYMNHNGANLKERPSVPPVHGRQHAATTPPPVMAYSGMGPSQNGHAYYPNGKHTIDQNGFHTLHQNGTHTHYQNGTRHANEHNGTTTHGGGGHPHPHHQNGGAPTPTTATPANANANANANGYRVHWPQEDEEGGRGFVNVSGGAPTAQGVVWSDNWETDKAMYSNMAPLCVSNRLNPVRKLSNPPNLITPSSSKSKNKPPSPTPPTDDSFSSSSSTTSKHTPAPPLNSHAPNTKPTTPQPQLLNTSSHSTRNTNAPHLQATPASPRSARHATSPHIHPPPHTPSSTTSATNNHRTVLTPPTLIM